MQEPPVNRFDTPGAVYEALARSLEGRGYSQTTVRSYLSWVRRFIKYHGRRDPSGMAIDDVRSFLDHLGAAGDVSASTRNQAASALAYLYKEVVGRDIVTPQSVPRARAQQSAPSVLTRSEVAQVLAELKGLKGLIAALLYGSGLRLGEALTLRIKDVDLEVGQLTVRRPKGGVDRRGLLPEVLIEPIGRYLRRRVELHRIDLKKQQGWAPLPAALHRKSPQAGWEVPWQFLFAARKISRDPKTGHRGRRPIHASAVQRAVRKAARDAHLLKRVTCHTFRHSFATHLLQSGCDIRTVQELLGHKSVKTTMIYTHVLNSRGAGVRSPLDLLDR